MASAAATTPPAVWSSRKAPPIFRSPIPPFQNILGNAVWTHSLYTSPRNVDGLIAQNRFDTIGRDAIQIGHATRVRVRNNSGTRIGYPVDAVDAETGGTPVAIDTAGNVDHTLYIDNHFAEINGKCMDLDGFHDGLIRANTCLNRKPPGQYAFGHFAIVMNNNNPDMHSQNITIEDNEIDGVKFGGIFVIGTGHKITGNRLRNLNTAHCNENAAQFGCLYSKAEPELLETGIYLSRGVQRLEPTGANIIRDNVIEGFRMKTRCIQAAPGVSLKENVITGNHCLDRQ